MSEMRFCPGSAYIGTATLDRKKRRVFCVVGRRGSIVSFAHIKDVCREQVYGCDGTEIGRIVGADGVEYFLSARVEVDVDNAFSVVKMCQA